MVLTICACTCAVVARAQAAVRVDEATLAAARDIGYAGVDAYQRGDYAIARERLQKAYAILHAPSLGLWSARAMIKLGQLLEAEERLLEVSRLPTSVGDESVQARARSDAAAEAAALAPRLPRLVVRVQSVPGSDPEISVDGAPLVAHLWGESRPIDPGRHVVRGVAGVASAEQVIEVSEAEYKTVTLVLGQPRRTVRALAWGLMTAGGLGLAVGAVTGGIAWSKERDLSKNKYCSPVDHTCFPDMGADFNGYNQMRTISTFSFIAGATVAATGALVLLGAIRASATKGSGKASSQELTVVILPGTAAMQGRF